MTIFESRFRPMKLSLGESPGKTLMKLVVDADTDKVLGCHMVGPEAGEIIQGIAVALKAGAMSFLGPATRSRTRLCARSP